MLGLDQRIIETMQLLPYINSPISEDRTRYLTEDEWIGAHRDDLSWWPGWMSPDRDILWRNGHFVDYRKDHDIWRSPDPLNRWRISYAKNISFEDAMMEFEGMPKSAIPLSIIKRRAYGLAIVLDTASNRILVLDTQG